MFQISSIPFHDNEKISRIIDIITVTQELFSYCETKQNN